MNNGVIRECELSYRAKATSVPNWEKMNKNDLINKYIEVENDPVKADAYMSAIILRYWGKIAGFIKLGSGIYDKSLYVEWLTGGILRGIKARKWLDPSSSVYGDPNGPDKVMNRCIMSERMQWYQDANTQKRKAGFRLESIDQIVENSMEEMLPHYENADIEESLDVRDLIRSLFKKQDYVTGFIVNAIVNYDVFDCTKDEKGRICSQFNLKKLTKCMLHIDSNVGKSLSIEYGVPYSEIEFGITKCSTMSRNVMRRRIDKGMAKLREVFSYAS